MKSVPAVPNLVHLKKQAKQLLRAVRAGDAGALHRLQQALPAARARRQPRSQDCDCTTRNPPSPVNMALRRGRSSSAMSNGSEAIARLV